MKECSNFPGVWTAETPTFRSYHPCTCATCKALWPCPTKLRTGDVIEVAESQGVYVATVVATGTLDNTVFMAYIESDDPCVEYKRRVHRKWTMSERSSLWRMFDGEHRWVPTPIETRFDRPEVL